MQIELVGFFLNCGYTDLQLPLKLILIMRCDESASSLYQKIPQTLAWYFSTFCIQFRFAVTPNSFKGTKKHSSDCHLFILFSLPFSFFFLLFFVTHRPWPMRVVVAFLQYKFFCFVSPFLYECISGPQLIWLFLAKSQMDKPQNKSKNKRNEAKREFKSISRNFPAMPVFIRYISIFDVLYSACFCLFERMYVNRTECK